MKTYIRTLWASDKRSLWDNVYQRENLRAYLNDMGFYALTGLGDSLDVYALEYSEPLDIRLLKIALDKLTKAW